MYCKNENFNAHVGIAVETIDRQMASRGFGKIVCTSKVHLFMEFFDKTVLRMYACMLFIGTKRFGND